MMFSVGVFTRVEHSLVSMKVTLKLMDIYVSVMFFFSICSPIPIVYVHNVPLGCVSAFIFLFSLYTQ